MSQSEEFGSIGDRNRPEASRTYRLAVLATGAALKLPGFNITASGLENLPREGGYILAAAHHNSWDVPAIGHVIYNELGRPVRFATHERLVRSRRAEIQSAFKERRYTELPMLLYREGYAGVLASAHALPISHEPLPSTQGHQLNEMARAVMRGGILGFFEEGERVNGYEVSELRGGVGYIACKPDVNVSVIPTAAAGRNFGEIWSNKAYIPRSLHVHFSPAINSEGLKPKDRKAFSAEVLRPAMQAALDEAVDGYQVIYDRSPLR